MPLTEEPLEVQTEAWLMKRIAVCPRGHAAEAAVFDPIIAASGEPACRDLAQATRIALPMETNLGLGADHPLVHRNIDLAGHPPLRDGDLLDLVDARLQAATQMAQCFVEAPRNRLLKLADALETAGTLDAGDIAEIFNGGKGGIPCNPQPSR